MTHELQLNLKNLGFFGRAFYFYDHAVADTDRTALSNDAKQYAERDVELLDAYVTGDFDAGGIPVSIRAGNQVISWGESVFLRNGLNSINPADISKLRVAGAEVRDVLEPIPAINVKTRISDKLSLEGFYQFRWVHTEIESAGTFFSTNDFASPGGNTAHLGFGVPGAADDRTARRTRDAPHRAQQISAPACRAPATGMPIIRASSAWRCVISRPS